MRVSPNLLRLAIVVVSVMTTALPPGGTSATADNSNPCDLVPSLPFCDSALGPLRDVTADWRSYQPALVQPVPISDYCADEPSCITGDPEDSSLGAGWCGTETVHQPATGPQIPASDEVSGLPMAIIATPPPGKNFPYAGSKYCLLRYIAADFSPLCDGCRRILLDYSAIPTGTYTLTSPASDGHWAARFTTGSNFSAVTPFNAHSPNAKNLCADKFVNSAPGADCTAAIAQFDNGAHSLEGDSTIFHHYPLEGRYFNGPSYLAGDGAAVPYHWINAAYFDVDLAGATSLPVWYNAGYRGLGDLPPDTDQSYGCLCEAPFQPLGLPGVPGAGHTTWSPSLAVQGASSPGGSNPSTPGSAHPGSPGSSTSLPNTGTPLPIPSVALALATAVLLLIAGLSLSHRARSQR